MGISFGVRHRLSDVAAALESELGESQSNKLVWKPNTTTELHRR